MSHCRRGKQHHHGGDVCGIVVVGLRTFPYYFYCRNPAGRDFFVPARTLIGVFLLINCTLLFSPQLKSGHFSSATIFKISCVLLLSWYIFMISTSYILDFAWSTRTIATLSLIKKNFALICFFFPLDKRPFLSAVVGMVQANKTYKK